jgi:hypothetical protein
MDTTRYVKVPAIVIAIASAGLLRVQANGSFLIPFKYETSLHGEIISGNVNFPGLLYYANEDCPSNHLDPNNQRFKHGHVEGEYFDFPHGGNTVTKPMSNWAWNDIYEGYTPVSESTFLAVCWSYATDMESGVILYEVAWPQWTLESSACEVTSKKKSYKSGTDHCIVIDRSFEPNEGVCLVTDTSEKRGSSGVYAINYGEGIVFDDEVRKSIR